MNDTIINRFNERVKKEDTVFFLGDFGFFSNNKDSGNGKKENLQDYYNKLNCKNIIMLEGNHDRKNRNKFKVLPIKEILIKMGGKEITLKHNPPTGNFKTKLYLTGHVHDKWLCKRIYEGENYCDCINLSVEQWNYYPVTINEIFSKYNRWLKEINVV